MVAPLPWSPSALDDFVNCPKSFHEKRVLKSVVQVQGPEASYGDEVHKKFELRQNGGPRFPLPPELAIHEPFMVRLDQKPGHHFCEMQMGLDRQGKCCRWDARDVWTRVKIDYVKIDDETKTATIVDYKTGKPHEKWRQLMLYAIVIFILFPNVDIINAQYYWTKTQTTSKKVWSRADIPMLWGEFIADLKQYVQAFKTDTWQARQSGLCNGWCPVTSCQFWKPKRER